MILITAPIGDGPPVPFGITEESRVNSTMATTTPTIQPIMNPTLVPFA